MHRSTYENGFLFFKENNSNELVRDIHKASLYFSNYQVMGAINIFHELAVIFIITGILIYNEFIIFAITVFCGGSIYFILYVFKSDNKKGRQYIKKIESGLPKKFSISPYMVTQIS